MCGLVIRPQDERGDNLALNIRKFNFSLSFSRNELAQPQLQQSPSDFSLLIRWKHNVMPTYLKIFS